MLVTGVQHRQAAPLPLRITDAPVKIESKNELGIEILSLIAATLKLLHRLLGFRVQLLGMPLKIVVLTRRTPA